MSLFRSNAFLRIIYVIMINLATPFHNFNPNVMEQIYFLNTSWPLIQSYYRNILSLKVSLYFTNLYSKQKFSFLITRTIGCNHNTVYLDDASDLITLVKKTSSPTNCLVWTSSIPHFISFHSFEDKNLPTPKNFLSISKSILTLISNNRGETVFIT